MKSPSALVPLSFVLVLFTFSPTTSLTEPLDSEGEDSVESTATERIPPEDDISTEVGAEELAPLPANPLDRYPSHLKKAAEAFLSGNLTTAKKRVLKMLPSLRDSEKDSAHVLLGDIAMQERDFARARTHFQKALRFRARNSDTLLKLGSAQYQSGLTELSRQNLEEALWFNKFQALTPADAYVRLSVVYEALELPELAEQALRKSLTAGEPSISALVTLSDRLLSEGRRVEALKLFNPSSLEKQKSSVQLAYARALLTNPDRIIEKRKLESLDRLLGKLSENEELPLDERKRVQVLTVRSKIALEEYDEADKLLTAVRKKHPSDPFVQRITQQLETERSASEEIEARKLAAKNTKEST